MIMRLLYYQSFANRSRRGTEHVYSIYDGGRSVRTGQMVRDRCQRTRYLAASRRKLQPFSGKHRPQYAPFLVSGDHVIIINADKIKLTGEKLDQKFYRWHTLYPGGSEGNRSP